MICDICRNEIVGDAHRVKLQGKDFFLCEWDTRRTKDFLECTESNHMINIFWGAGHINWTCWFQIREYLRKYKITEILEFGIGLSSELFVNEGIRVVGFDVYKEHVEQYQNLRSLKNDAVFHHYEDKKDGPPVEELYPGRKWDFVFVDGPQERSREVAVAMRVAKKFIYLHDPNLGEESFFPTEEWVGQETEPKFFIKKESAI